MQASFILLTALAFSGPQAPRQGGAAPGTGPARPSGCRIALIEEVNVAAQEPGVLLQLEAKESMLYDEGTSMGRIDDTLQQAQRLERQAEYAAAKELAEDDIEERYAVAATNVSAAEYDVAVAANKRAPNAITSTELRRLQLTWHKSELQIEKARHDRKVAKMTAEAKGARVQEIDAMIDRRQVKAPISGMVVDIIKHRGEWVQPGDTILKMVRLDRLRVKGFLKASEYTTADVVGRPVIVEVALARGRKVQVPGKVTHASPSVEGGEFAVWAEIVNKQEGPHWLLGEGLACEMAIDVAPGVAGAVPAARR